MEVTRSPRERRPRTLTASLLQITLVLEACTVLFATITMFGLDKFSPDWMAWIYGGILLVLFVLAAGVQHRPWGVWFGAVLQVVLIATGFLEPMLFVLGLGFAGLWIYCFVKGRQIDTQKAAWLAQQTSADAHTEGDSS